MKIKLIVDWDNQEIWTEREFKEFIKEQANDNIMDSSDNFSDWLTQSYSGVEIFNATQSEKEEMISSYKNYLEQNHYDDGCEEYFVEV